MEDGKVEIGLPDRMEIRHGGYYLELVRKWFGWNTVVFTVLAASGYLFVFMEYSNIDRIGWSRDFLFFPIEVLVIIGLTYYALAGWFNRTHIFVSHDRILVRHRPLPFLGNKTLSASDIKQLYAKKKISRRLEGDTSVTYEVHAITHGGRNVKLVRGLDSSEQALFIEQEIEKYLGIQDAPVKGELGKYQRKVPPEAGKPCPTCGNSNVRHAYIEDGGYGDWCPDCKMSLKKMRGLMIS